MGKLDFFLKPNTNIEEEVIISKRFVDENNKLIPIKIRAITQAENNSIIKRCTIVEKDRQGNRKETLDKTKYSTELVLACVIEPNFKSPEFVEKMGASDPATALNKLLLPGEYIKLSEAVYDIMGMGDIVEQAKNS